METPIGNLPTPDALDLNHGLNITADQINQLLTVDATGWRNEIADVAANYKKFGTQLPAALNRQLEELGKRIG